MEGATYSPKSKLYCSHCGSFNLTQSRLSNLATTLFRQPVKLICQCCHGAISHTEMLSNEPKHLPRMYCASNDAIKLAADSLGRTIYISTADTASANSRTN